MHQFWFLFLLLSMIFTGACAPRIPVPEKASEETLNVAKAITSAMQSRRNVFKGVETETEVKIHYPGESFRTEAMLIEWRPSNLRLECLGLFNQPLLSLATDGEHFNFVSIANMSCYTGFLNAASISRHVPKEINMQDIFAWLLGEHNFEGRRPVSFKPQIDNPSLLVMKFWNERTQSLEEIWFDPSETLVRKVLVTDSHNREVVSMESSGVLRQNGITYPDTVVMSMPAGITVQVSYRKVLPLEQKPAGVFSIPCPAGFKHKNIN